MKDNSIMRIKYRLFFSFLISCCFFAQNSSQDLNYLPKSKKGVLVQHKYFSLSYVSKYKNAEWVAYRLVDTMLHGTAKRKNNFCVDPMVPGGTACPNDFPPKEYDRGHLCPAEDMSFSQEATDSTFYMSNMSPQMGTFNRGVWKKLENRIRNWAKKYREIYVVSGPVLKNGLQRIGPKKDISVPKEFYKVVLVYQDTVKRMIGFILPHRKIKESLEQFAVPVDSIEKITRIDFFPDLPDKIERQLEKKVSLAGWN